MAKERPIVEQDRYDRNSGNIFRAIISPCTGCRNNVPVPTDTEDAQDGSTQWACPKQRLYSQKLRAEKSGDRSKTYDHPVYNERLKGVNPVWPGVETNGESNKNNYAYVFLAFYEDNVENGYNPEWDTKKIRCRGPFLMMAPERYWNFFGHAEQGDHILAFLSYYYIDGAAFKGFAQEASTYKVASGYTRKIDFNLGRTLSGAPRY